MPVGEKEPHVKALARQPGKIKIFGLSYLALPSFNAAPEAPGPAKASLPGALKLRPGVHCR